MNEHEDDKTLIDSMEQMTHRELLDMILQIADEEPDTVIPRIRQKVFEWEQDLLYGLLHRD